MQKIFDVLIQNGKKGWEWRGKHIATVQARGKQHAIEQVYNSNRSEIEAFNDVLGGYTLKNYGMYALRKDNTTCKN